MVHLIHFLSIPGGIESLTPLILQQIESRGIKVFVIRPPAAGAVNIYGESNTDITYGSSNNLLAFFRLLVYALSHRKDIFHVFNIGPYFLFILRLAGCGKIIYSIHGTIYWKKKAQKFFRKQFWRLSSGKNVLFTANSQFSRDVFLNTVLPGAQIGVLYNPIPATKFHLPHQPIKNEKLKIVFAGRLSPEKNLFEWLEMARAIHAVIPKTLFELHGEGFLREELEKRILEINAGDYISLKGFSGNLCRVFHEADLLLFLSKFESFGNVVVESILCGTPVIATAIPSMKEIFENYPEFLVENNEDIKKTIINKISQIEELKKLVPLAREEFMERFSLEQHIQKLEQIYNSFHNQ